MNVFSQKIQELRYELSLKQSEFAKALGISSATVSAWERGDKVPSIDKAMAIAKTFEVSLDWLFGLSDSMTTNELPQIKTMADLFKALLLIADLNTVTIESGEDSVENAKQHGFRPHWAHGTVSYAEIRIWDDNFLSDFLNDWKKLRELEMKNALPQGVYDIYIYQKMKEFRDKPIPEYIPPEDDQDSFLPF